MHVFRRSIRFDAANGRAGESRLREGVHRQGERREGRSAGAGGSLTLRACRRLHRSLEARSARPFDPGLIALAADLSARKVDFRSFTDGFDTSTASGRLLFHVLASVAEMERELVKERTIAGLAAARAKGGVGGGRKSAMTPDTLDTARAHRATHPCPVAGRSAAGYDRRAAAPQALASLRPAPPVAARPSWPLLPIRMDRKQSTRLNHPPLRGAFFNSPGRFLACPNPAAPCNRRGHGTDGCGPLHAGKAGHRRTTPSTAALPLPLPRSSGAGRGHASFFTFHISGRPFSTPLTVLR